MPFDPISNPLARFARRNPQLVAASVVAVAQIAVGELGKVISYSNNRLMVEVRSSAEAHFLNLKKDEILPKLRQKFPIDGMSIRIRR